MPPTTSEVLKRLYLETVSTSRMIKRSDLLLPTYDWKRKRHYH